MMILSPSWVTQRPCSPSPSFAFRRSSIIDRVERIRTSSDVRINRDGVYGNLNVDPRLEGLWHVPSCASGHTFCMDLEFREGAPVPEMDEREDSACVVQV